MHAVKRADGRVPRSQHEFCDEFHEVDLRDLQNCLKVTKNVDYVFNLAADMVR